MDDGELRLELAQLIAGSGGTVTEDLVDLQLAVLRADLEATRKYVMAHAPHLPCPITAIGWDDDEEVAHHTMGGWAECGTTTFVVLSGRHRRFTEAPRSCWTCCAPACDRNRCCGEPPAMSGVCGTSVPDAPDLGLDRAAATGPAPARPGARPHAGCRTLKRGRG
jgi:hypothetical protein